MGKVGQIADHTVAAGSFGAIQQTIRLIDRLKDMMVHQAIRNILPSIALVNSMEMKI
ncbi:hypothetical protein HNQ53_001475 [Microbulbifer hydrolyticus]|uniref:Uncharacterized protein n=1 Tax=Microbulbifer hydrolyticus TaxID=48074 RepID=A0AA89PU53_9GAMM|nr:hypothetical protein [Microbulbifer hydrolyticus]